MKSYIRNGWANNLKNPDLEQVSSDTHDAKAGHRPPSITTTNWKDFKFAYTKQDIPLFTDGQLVTYFVCRTVADGLPAGDFKSMNKSAKYLFDCGHITEN